MKKTSVLVWAFATILMLSVGCGGSDEMTEPGGTQLSLVAETTDPAVDENTVFKVTASNAQSHIVSVAFDYTGDGTWDEIRNVDASSVTEVFTWVYDASGDYTVRAEVREATDTPTTMTLAITVADARSVAVSLLLTAVTAEGGPCNAFGPPAACSGCAVTLGHDLSTVVRRPLGMHQHGSTVSVSQGFSQGPFTGGGDIFYACSFTARLVSGTQPYERAMGSGYCATSSKVNPVILNCTASVTAFVP